MAKVKEAYGLSTRTEGHERVLEPADIPAVQTEAEKLERWRNEPLVLFKEELTRMGIDHLLPQEEGHARMSGKNPFPAYYFTLRLGSARYPTAHTMLKNGSRYLQYTLKNEKIPNQEIGETVKAIFLVDIAEALYYCHLARLRSNSKDNPSTAYALFNVDTLPPVALRKIVPFRIYA